MDIVVLGLEPVSILAICIMIGTLVFAYIKKWMITYALIIANIVVFILTILFYYPPPYDKFSVLIYELGFRPEYLSLQHIPQLYTLFTSMFIHGGFLHIFGNMLIFFFVGLPFEQRIGRKKFLTIYLLTGVCGTLTHSLLNLGSPTILIGASGAIFGIMGAFAFAYPRDEVVMPIGIGIMFLTRIKVIYAVIFFAAVETFIVWLDVKDTTAHFAHLGGLISGVVLAALLIRRQKTHAELGKTIYYDSFNPLKTEKIDLSNLKKLATSAELKEELKNIEAETLPQVRDVWLEHFIEKTRCPKCGKSLNHFDKKIWCESCGFKTNY